MYFKFYEIISYIVVVQTYLLSGFIIANSIKKHASTKLLFVFIFSISLWVTNCIVELNAESLKTTAPSLFYVFSCFSFLIAPSLYLYILLSTREKKDFKPIDFIHLIPFLIIITAYILNFHMKEASTKKYLIENGPILTHTFKQIMHFVYHFLFATYLYLSIIALNHFKKKAKNQLSNPNSVKTNWFYVLVGFIILIWLLDLTNFLLPIFNLDHVFILYLIVKILILSLCLFISYSGFKDKYVFLDINTTKKYKYSSLSKSEISKYVEEIMYYFNEKKAYLNPDLNLSEVSKYLKIPARSVSQIINDGLNQNFYDMVNKFRIEEAKSLLESQSSEDKTISEIMYNVGYETKSAFYKAFKKYTNTTPIEYRKNYN